MLIQIAEGRGVSAAEVAVASGQPRVERVNIGLCGLARRAVADSDVRSPARRLAIRCMRPGDPMGRRAGKKVGGCLGHLPQLVWEKSAAGVTSGVVML
jgi:hypothetical protein